MEWILAFPPVTNVLEGSKNPIFHGNGLFISIFWVLNRKNWLLIGVFFRFPVFLTRGVPYPRLAVGGSKNTKSLENPIDFNFFEKKVPKPSKNRTVTNGLEGAKSQLFSIGGQKVCDKGVN